MTGIGALRSGRIARPLTVVAIALGYGALAAPASATQEPGADQNPLLRKYVPAVRAALGTAAASRPPSAGPDVRLESCKEAKPGGMCGTVTVPLDRLDPSKGTLDLFFVFFPHEGPAPTSEAILITEGGPGFSVTQDEFLVGFYRGIFDPLMKTRDMIMLDQRGVGRSGAINCPELQHGTNDVAAAVTACGTQLGPAASLYASDNVAADIEAVRTALGYELLDLYGGSNAALDIQAYASRFPDHIRSAVLDSPATTLGFAGFDPLTLDQWLKAARLICARSRSCSAERRDATRDIAWLARRLRTHPFKGSGVDADGNRHRVQVTEGVLVWSMLGSDAAGFAPPGELGAAADALRHGDRKPLLRLAAEAAGPFFGDEGKPTEFSTGDNFARFCNDYPMPWDKSASRQDRLAQFEAARAALPDDAFAPFSIDAWLAPLPIGPIGPDVCIDWPAPTYDIPAPIPAGAQLPGNVPALVLTGDVDLSTPPATARLLADAWPNSTLVEILNSGHHTATPLGSREICADPIIVRFVADLKTSKTGCAKDVFPMWAAVGRFAEKADQARQARRARGDDSTATDRKVATVATAAVTDAIRRSFMQSGPNVGRGLRGGRFETGFGPEGAETELDKVRFAHDVAVSGGSLYRFEDETVHAHVKVRGPAGANGQLRIRGAWLSFYNKPATSFKLRGRLGGHEIALRVPAS